MGHSPNENRSFKRRSTDQNKSNSVLNIMKSQDKLMINRNQTNNRQYQKLDTRKLLSLQQNRSGSVQKTFNLDKIYTDNNRSHTGLETLDLDPYGQKTAVPRQLSRHASMSTLSPKGASHLLGYSVYDRQILDSLKTLKQPNLTPQFKKPGKPNILPPLQQNDTSIY